MASVDQNHVAAQDLLRRVKFEQQDVSADEVKKPRRRAKQGLSRESGEISDGIKDEPVLKKKARKKKDPENIEEKEPKLKRVTKLKKITEGY